MMRPFQWDAVLDPEVPVAQANAVIAEAVQAYLLSRVGAPPLTTEALVEILYPAHFTRSAASEATRNRIKKALTKRALGSHQLHGWWHEGPRTWLEWFNCYGRPVLWRAPEAAYAGT